MSEKEEIFERLKKILMNLLKIYRDNPNQRLPILTLETDLIEELGVDSLESLDLMNAIEEEFDVSPNMNEANSKRKIIQIIDYIIELQLRKKIKK